MSNKPPIEVPQGAIRLNTDSQKLEFYAQDRWYEMATDVPTLDGGVRGLFGGGGFLLDSGCYPICASRMIFDEEPISAFGKKFFEEKKFSNGKVGPVDVSGSAILFYENGKTATISYVNGSYYQAKYEVWGTDGVISLDRAYSVPPDFTTKVTLQYNTENNWEGRRTETFEIQPKDHFLEMIDVFCMEIAGTKKAPFDFEQELLNQAKTIEAVVLGNQIKMLSDISW